MRLLLVEDELKLAASLTKVLQGQGYAVDVFNDGQQGYFQAATENYDLILLDIGLPTMDGLQICTALRQEGNSTPILMLTARDDTADKIVGLDGGADDYLVKPFQVDELLARIRSLLRRGKSDPVILKVGSLQLNPATKQVSRQDTIIDLSAREYALLEFFMRHPKHILSKQQLLDHVWGGEVDPFSNVIDVYMGYLRNKIDRPFPDQPALITTVKGLGYKIDSTEK